MQRKTRARPMEAAFNALEQVKIYLFNANNITYFSKIFHFLVPMKL